MKRHHVELTVNGQTRDALTEPRTTLADFLRDELELTGTHLGCEHGVCGACTVLLDGDAVRSCLVFAVQAAGRDVVTIEGLADVDNRGQLVLHPLQQAFYEAISFQCGFCTPGFLMSSLAFLREHDAGGGGTLDDQQIREMLSGNLCRCTGYTSIVDGIKVALGNGAGQAPLPHER
ncbi:MAG: (2Fe-2S)-binding protein [Actinobacteria bacterium]|nr:MAG: (2Fe-2S)-binding protein [Actinomycetota bacterium]